MVVKQFRADDSSKDNIKKSLEQAFNSISESDQKTVLAELTAHQKYIDDLHSASAARITAVIERSQSTPFGPGSYLARWQNLLDETLITPLQAKGPLRKGGSKSVKEEGRKDVQGNEAGFLKEEEVEKVVDRQTPKAPVVENTVRLLGGKFREALAGG